MWGLWLETRRWLRRFRLWFTGVCVKCLCVAVCVFIILSRSLCVCACMCSAYGGHRWTLTMNVCVLAGVCEYVFSSCVSFSLLYRASARGHSWPLARNKRLEYSWATVSTSSSSSSSWQDFRAACLQLAFTLPPTGFHCFYWHHLAAIGLFCIRGLMVFCIVLCFGWFALFSDGFHCSVGFV